MRRLLLACLVSVLAYAVTFGLVLDRPLAYGFLERQLDAKLARAASIGGPKLVILAGSNGPYSHRCETIEPIIERPCVNGGVAVGIGLDYLFARWQPLLHPGDIVYLPLEEAQWTRTRAATTVGPDAAIMFRHDWATLAGLPPDRWAGALFSFDLRFAVMSVIEHALLARGFHDPRATATGTTNAWGDHVGHRPELGDPAAIAAENPSHPGAAAIGKGFGTRTVAQFLTWAASHGVLAIGGWPTEPDDSPIPDSTREAIRAVFQQQGAMFLELPNRSLYPRSAFFDTPDHLNEVWQIRHATLIGEALRRVIGPGPCPSPSSPPVATICPDISPPLKPDGPPIPGATSAASTSRPSPRTPAPSSRI